MPASLLLPEERAARRVRALAWVLTAVAGLLVVSLLDRWVWAHATLTRAEFERLETRDYYQLARQFGYLPLWLLLAACVGLVDGRWRRGVMIALSAGLGGGAAEVLKLIVQRFRPGEDGEYVFRWVMGGVPGGALVKGLGMASSHAGVAFGGAFMVGMLWPRARWVAIGCALACAWTRLVSGAHFLSDVYVAGVMSYGVARMVKSLSERA